MGRPVDEQLAVLCETCYTSRRWPVRNELPRTWLCAGRHDHTQVDSAGMSGCFTQNSRSRWRNASIISS